MYFRIILTLAVIGAVASLVALRRLRAVAHATAPGSEVRLPSEADERLDARIGCVRLAGTFGQAVRSLEAAAEVKIVAPLSAEMLNRPVRVTLDDVTLGDTLIDLVSQLRMRQSPGDDPIHFGVQGGAIVISHVHYIDGTTRFYGIRDLVANAFPPLVDEPARPAHSPTGPRLFGSGSAAARAEAVVEMLATLIRETVDPDSWRDYGGSLGSIREMSGVLVVTTSWENHRHIGRLLANLRASLASQAATPLSPAGTRTATAQPPPWRETNAATGRIVEYRLYDVAPLLSAMISADREVYQRAMAHSLTDEESFSEPNDRTALRGVQRNLETFLLRNVPGDWHENGALTGTISFVGSRLLVRQVPTAHADIEVALKQLTEAFTADESDKATTAPAARPSPPPAAE